MSKIAFVFASNSLFGSISIMTLINLRRAIRSLKRGKFDVVYVALNHLDDDDRISASDYIQKNFIENMPDELQSFVVVADEKGLYAEKFVDYIRIFSIPDGLVANIFSDIFYQNMIMETIERAHDLLMKNKVKVPPLLMG